MNTRLTFFNMLALGAFLSVGTSSADDSATKYSIEKALAATIIGGVSGGAFGYLGHKLVHSSLNKSIGLSIIVGAASLYYFADARTEAVASIAGKELVPFSRIVAMAAAVLTYIKLDKSRE